MKKLLKKFVARILAGQVRRLRRRNKLTVVAVCGSIGKTSSKLAIASVLASCRPTRYQTGNYNDIVSVPLVFFGEALPSLFNPLAWLWVFVKNEFKVHQIYPYEVVVLELGTDGPGQIKEFKKYIEVDIGFLTAITPEHMQFFPDIDAVAAEELGILKIAKKTFINEDLVDKKYLANLKNKYSGYGINQPAEFRLADIRFNGDEAIFSFMAGGKKIFTSAHQQISEPQLYSICAAATVAYELGFTPSEIDAGIRKIPAVSGRMQHLDGLNGSLIIDDTYNASPQAMTAALDSLYRMEANNKIAILGNMNELGHFSKQEHENIGRYCQPKQLDLVVTIGPDANKYLAPVAQAAGCKVKTFNDPYSAGKFIAPLLREGSIVLAKGSQNKVFAEETVKLLLENPTDSVKLVRQSPHWLKVKRKNFKNV